MRNCYRPTGIFAGIEPDHPHNRGLVADWTVTNRPGWSRGATLRDLAMTVRRSYPGTLTSGPTWQGAKGRQGGFGALQYDGSDDYVDCGTIAAMVQPVTVAAWVNPTNFAATRTIFGGTSGVLQFRINTSGVLAFVKLNILNIGASTGTVTAGVWSFVAGTYDAAGNFAFYLNGVLIGTGTNSTNMEGFGVQLGRNGVSAGAEQFLGQMDSNLVLSRVLSAREIAALYDETRLGNPERYRWAGGRWFLGTTTGIFGFADNRDGTGNASHNASGTGSADRNCSGSGKLAGFSGTGRPPD